MATQVRQLTPEITAGIRKRMVQIGLLMVFEGALLFVSAGRLDWTWAWVFLGLYLAGILVNSVFMFRYSPETIARRASGEGMKDWDKVVSGLWAVAGVTQFIAAGLDVRYGWSGELPLAWHLVGGVGFILGFALFSWAMMTNAYFATV
ncbi:MAG: hypothetical protein K8I30_21135, partial [Anaerolineae bacterium]|nr:hypothetical protein [Anaerolineae bacterium]